MNMKNQPLETGPWSWRMAPQSCTVQNTVLKTWSYKSWGYSLPKGGKIKGCSVLIIFTWICVYAWIELLPLLLFFSWCSQWRVPGVSDDNIAWLPTKVPMPKKWHQPINKTLDWHFSGVQKRRKWNWSDTPWHLLNWDVVYLFTLSVLY